MPSKLPAGPLAVVHKQNTLQSGSRQNSMSGHTGLWWACSSENPPSASPLTHLVVVEDGEDVVVAAPHLVGAAVGHAVEARIADAHAGAPDLGGGMP